MKNINKVERSSYEAAFYFIAPEHNGKIIPRKGRDILISISTNDAKIIAASLRKKMKTSKHEGDKRAVGDIIANCVTEYNVERALMMSAYENAHRTEMTGQMTSWLRTGSSL